MRLRKMPYYILYGQKSQETVIFHAGPVHMHYPTHRYSVKGPESLSCWTSEHLRTAFRTSNIKTIFFN